MKKYLSIFEQKEAPNSRFVYSCVKTVWRKFRSKMKTRIFFSHVTKKRLLILFTSFISFSFFFLKKKKYIYKYIQQITIIKQDEKIETNRVKKKSSFDLKINHAVYDKFCLELLVQHWYHKISV